MFGQWLSELILFSLVLNAWVVGFVVIFVCLFNGCLGIWFLYLLVMFAVFRFVVLFLFLFFMGILLFVFVAMFVLYDFFLVLFFVFDCCLIF